MSTLTLGGSTLASKSGSVLSLDSGVTFPAGHIIQTFTDTYNGAVTTIGSTADDYLGTNLEVTITPQSTSNILIVRCLIGNYYNNAAVNRKLEFGFRYHADWTGTPAQLGPREFVITQLGRISINEVIMMPAFAETITTAPVAGSVMKIRPWLQAPAGDVQIFNGSVALGSLSVMEIQA